MRILFYCCGSENPGVEALSAYLKSKGHTVGLLFDPRQGSNFYFNVPLLNNFVSRDMLLRKARAFEPELVAVSFLTNQFQEVGAFMSYLRQHIHVPVIAGGFHAFSLPDMLIKEDWVDMLCLGEGEETMAELADAMSRNEPYDNIRNLWIKKTDGQIVKNPLRPLIKNLDALPIPDKDIFVPYGIINRRLMVMTSRGCPYKCSYCINSFRDALYPTQKYLRRKTPEAAIDELIEYKKKFKPRFIQFYDDVFSYDAAWLETFSTLYPQKIGLPFECYITPTTANDKIVSLLKNRAVFR
jgi:anaerobic magnesium-protoporphyrin IX monomethyl ester cyclase